MGSIPAGTVGFSKSESSQDAPSILYAHAADRGGMRDFFTNLLTAYLALNNMVRNSRFEWDTKTAADRAARDTYITEAIAAVPQYKADIAYRMSQQDSAIGSFLDSFMSIGQLFEALSGTDGFRTVARDTLIRIANASPAILNARKEINHTLVEAYLRLYKPAAYAKLPTKYRRAAQSPATPSGGRLQRLYRRPPETHPHRHQP